MRLPSSGAGFAQARQRHRDDWVGQHIGFAKSRPAPVRCALADATAVRQAQFVGEQSHGGAQLAPGMAAAAPAADYQVGQPVPNPRPRIDGAAERGAFEVQTETGDAVAQATGVVQTFGKGARQLCQRKSRRTQLRRPPCRRLLLGGRGSVGRGGAAVFPTQARPAVQGCALVQHQSWHLRDAGVQRLREIDKALAQLRAVWVFVAVAQVAQPLQFGTATALFRQSLQLPPVVRRLLPRTEKQLCAHGFATLSIVLSSALSAALSGLRSVNLRSALPAVLCSLSPVALCGALPAVLCSLSLVALCSALPAALSGLRPLTLCSTLPAALYSFRSTILCSARPVTLCSAQRQPCHQRQKQCRSGSPEDQCAEFRRVHQRTPGGKVWRWRMPCRLLRVLMRRLLTARLLLLVLVAHPGFGAAAAISTHGWSPLDLCGGCCCRCLCRWGRCRLPCGD